MIPSTVIYLIKEKQVQLIIVDNASTDETKKVIEDFSVDNEVTINYVYEKKNGLSNARNAGLKFSTGDIIVFTDDDCYIDGDYFRLLGKHLYSNYNNNESDSLNFWGGGIRLYNYKNAFYGSTRITTSVNIGANSFIPCNGLLQGANMIISRQVYQKIGLFDANLGAGSCFRFEDIDYLARASLAGFNGAFIPELIVYHDHKRQAKSLEIERVMKEDDIARGAYYAKVSLLASPRVTYHWLRHLRSKEKKIFLREVKGFLLYMMFIVRKREWPSIVKFHN
jgi:glycosyltransferase involved in cell wall biosynthesis